MTPDGTQAWVINVFDDTVSVLDVATRTVVATLSMGNPFRLAMTPDGTQAWVINVFDGTVSVISTGLAPPVEVEEAPVEVEEAPVVTAPLLDLTVALDGDGTGVVTSTPPGILCPPICTAFYPTDTEVTLVASSNEAATFTGWDGVFCPDGNACTFALQFPGTVTATFEELPDLTGALEKVSHKARTAGDKLTVTMRLENRGTPLAPDQGFSLAYWLSDDRVLDETDILLTTEDLVASEVGPIGTGVKLKRKVHQMVQAALPAMAGRFLLVHIDEANAIPEGLLEQNNVLVHQLFDRGCSKEVWRVEREPATVEIPQKAGSLRAGTCLTIAGEENTVGRVDGYKVTARETLEVEMILTHEPESNFDLILFDFATGTTLNEVSCNKNFTTPERCVLTLPAEQAVVVGVFPADDGSGGVSGTGRYQLTVGPR